MSQIRVPEMGESVASARVARWLKQEGEQVTAGEPVVALETEKVDLEVTAERPGVLRVIHHPAGDEVQTGELLGTVEDAAEAAGVGSTSTAATAQAAPTVERPIPAAPSPNVALGHAAEDHATAPAAPPPKSAETPVAAAAPHASVPAPPVPAPLSRMERSDREERVRMSLRRQTIARRLVEAQHTAAMLTTFNEVDMGAVADLRRRRKQDFLNRHRVGLGITSFFVKAAIVALKAFPSLNAEVDGDEMILKHHYDIGIAVGAADGLVVPVLRDADRLSLAEIERAIKALAEKVEQKALSVEDLRGGTFTITNGGVFGSLLSTPILNLPQVGILGLHTIQERPVARGGQVAIHPMMYVALSYDHRIVDGREAVQFLVRVKGLIETPEDLLLDG
jgi:2-oxoglutarate dehydrogenase E2 component (dihydrolipoamide succinyltransferase)